MISTISFLEVAGLAALTYGQEVALRFWNALFTAVLTAAFVAAGAALAVNFVQARSEARKEATQVRHDLVTRTTGLHGPFYFSTQHFSRRKRQHGANLPADEIDRFDQNYLDFAAAAQSMEEELRSWFGTDSEPVKLWHQIHDLLTIRYFALKDRNTENLREVNAKGYEDLFHSGLEATQLTDQKLVLRTYRQASVLLGAALRQASLRVAT